MSGSTQCPHLDFFVQADCTRIADKAPLVMLDLTCECKTCGKPMRFVGDFPNGHSPSRPMLNPDATQLRVPMIGADDDMPADLGPEFVVRRVV